MTLPRTIVAMGGGGFQMEPDNLLLDDYVLSIARERSGRARPRICLIPTATADDPALISLFERLFAPRAETNVLSLFRRSDEDLATMLLGQDAVYVTGGNTANLLALWRLHGLDRVVRAAWNEGVVMAGMSAGAICWFESCTTDSFGPVLRPLHGGLGILDGSFVPHYHGEPQRRPHCLGLVADGTLPPGYAVDDGVALVFHDRSLAAVVASDPSGGAWRIQPDDRGGATETPLPVQFLG